MERDLAGLVGEPILSVCRGVGSTRLAPAFYLAGGTGLALQLGHRRSEDLDFFTVKPTGRVAVRTVGNELLRVFGQAKSALVQSQVDQVTWRIDGTRVSFVAYPFRLHFPLVDGALIHPALENLCLAAPGEIGLMKAYALGRRATFRDYLDLYVLLKRRMITLDDLVQGGLEKFVLEGRKIFSQRLFLEQLVYLKDLDDVGASLRLTIEPVRPEQVEQFFRQQVKEYVRRGLPQTEDAP